MTINGTCAKAPGLHVLRLARLVFSDAAIETMVEPAIADLQREAAAASLGSGQIWGRLRVNVRGYLALWTVVAMAALIPGAGAGAPVLAMMLGLHGGFLVLFLAPLLFVVLFPAFGSFMTGAVIVGLLFSFAVRAWNDRHPVTLAKRRASGKDPEINISGIPVGGDVGGFLFVVASVLMMLGLEDLRSFVGSATLAALLLASGLLVWQRHHLESPVRRIIG